MPRVTPRAPRFEPDEIVKSWQSFTYDDDEGAHTIRTGVRLRGDHPAVRRCPWCFTKDAAPDDQTPSLFPDLVEPAPRFTQATRVRVRYRTPSRRRCLREGQRVSRTRRYCIVAGKRGNGGRA
jgi:hypothetical protein